MYLRVQMLPKYVKVFAWQIKFVHRMQPLVSEFVRFDASDCVNEIVGGDLLRACRFNEPEHHRHALYSRPVAPRGRPSHPPAWRRPARLRPRAYCIACLFCISLQALRFTPCIATETLIGVEGCGVKMSAGFESNSRREGGRVHIFFPAPFAGGDASRTPDSAVVVSRSMSGGASPSADDETPRQRDAAAAAAEAVPPPRGRRDAGAGQGNSGRQSGRRKNQRIGTSSTTTATTDGDIPSTESLQTSTTAPEDDVATTSRGDEDDGCVCVCTVRSRSNLDHQRRCTAGHFC